MWEPYSIILAKPWAFSLVVPGPPAGLLQIWRQWDLPSGSRCGSGRQGFSSKWGRDPRALCSVSAETQTSAGSSGTTALMDRPRLCCSNSTLSFWAKLPDIFLDTSSSFCSYHSIGALVRGWTSPLLLHLLEPVWSQQQASVLIRIVSLQLKQHVHKK